MLSASLTRRSWLRRASLALCLPLVFAAAAGCDDAEEEPGPTEPPAFDPYADAAQVRFVHLAPSFANLVVQLDRPANQYTTEDGETPIRLGDPVLRPITGDGVIGYTGFTPDFAPAPTGARVTIEQNGAVINEATYDELAAGESYYVVLVESAGESALELLPVANPKDGFGDGRAHIGIFHADSDVGTVDVALQAVGGGDTAQWGGVSFGDKSNVATLQDVAPGEYQLAIVRGTDPVQMVAPETLTLPADAVVHMIIAPPANDGEVPRLIFLTDVAGQTAFADPAAEFVEPTE